MVFQWKTKRLGFSGRHSLPLRITPSEVLPAMLCCSSWVFDTSVLSLESTELHGDQRCASWLGLAFTPGSTPLCTHFQISSWENGGVCVCVGGGGVALRDMQSVRVCCLDGFLCESQTHDWASNTQTDNVSKNTPNSFFSPMILHSKYNNFIVFAEQALQFHQCYKTFVWLYLNINVTFLSHISNLNKYSALSQCSGREFSFESSLSARHMWIWGFSLLLPCRFGPAHSELYEEHLWKAIFNSFHRFFHWFQLLASAGPHEDWTLFFSVDSRVDWDVFIRIIVPLQHIIGPIWRF